MSADASAADRLSPTQRLDLADQCRAVTLSAHGTQLVDAAVELHLVGNDGSDERWATNQSYRERAEMGYRAEVAVAEHYGLRPVVDYRPPTVGDAGHDYRLALDGETLTVDVKATRTIPPALFLTQKRAESDRYTLPDAYLLCSTELGGAGDVHLVGWIRTADLIERGEDTTCNGNPVWRLSWDGLSAPPDQSRVDALPTARREVWAAADRAGVSPSESVVRECEQMLVTDGGGEA